MCVFCVSACVLCYLCILCVCVFSMYMCVFAFLCVCLCIFCVYSGKESACRCMSHRRRGFDPWVGNGNPLHSSCLENPTDRGASVGYRTYGHDESDMMAQRSTCLCVCLHVCLSMLCASGCVCVCVLTCVCPLGESPKQGWWSNVVTPQCAHSLRCGGGGGRGLSGRDPAGFGVPGPQRDTPAPCFLPGFTLTHQGCNSVTRQAEPSPEINMGEMF